MYSEKQDACRPFQRSQKEAGMIVFKVLLIAALVIPLIYIGAVMMNSILDEVLKDGKERKDREK